jgi:hypothetical protein
MPEIIATSATATEEELRQALAADTEPEPKPEEPKPQEPEPETEEKPPEEKKPPVQRLQAYDKKIAKLLNANAELRGMVEEQSRSLRQAMEQLQVRTAPATPTSPAARPEPTREQFATYEDWVRAAADWQLDQKLAERDEIEVEEAQQAHAKEVFDSYNERVAEFAAGHEDFNEVLGSLSDRVVIPQAVSVAIYEAPNGPELSYYLAKNPEKAKELMEMTDTVAVMEIGRLSASLQVQSAVAKRPVSKAPPPPPHVGSGGTTSTMPIEKMTYQEYKQWHRQQQR